jgi:hypothetical protein
MHKNNGKSVVSWFPFWLNTPAAIRGIEPLPNRTALAANQQPTLPWFYPSCAYRYIAASVPEFLLIRFPGLVVSALSGLLSAQEL